MPETNTATETNTPEALLQECREALIEGINGYMPFILDEHTEMEDLRVLRDILDYAHMHGNSILTGVGHALSRERADAIWVRPEHKAAVNRYAAMLEEADDALGNRKRTTIDEPGAAQIRDNVTHWLSTWSDIRLSEWWQLGLAVEKHVSPAATPVEGAIVEMGCSYWMASHGRLECTLDTLQADLDKARKLSASSYDEEQANEEQPTDADTLRAAKYRAVLQKWIDTFEPHALKDLHDFGIIAQRAEGCTTPVEEFICRISHKYALDDRDGKGLTFQSIEDALDEAKDDFKSTVATALFIAKRYPEAMIDAEAKAHA